METLECIRTRRSRRLFLGKRVSDEIIQKIIKCAISSPSSVDCQPWHFIVVQDKNRREVLAKLKETDNRQHILTAPILIVVCVDTKKSPSRYIEDGVCATQNILLTVHDLGLGSVYVTGGKPANPKIALRIKQILSLPDRIMPISILPVGYPDPSEVLDQKSLVKVTDVIHNDKW